MVNDCGVWFSNTPKAEIVEKRGRTYPNQHQLRIGLLGGFTGCVEVWQLLGGVHESNWLDKSSIKHGGWLVLGSKRNWKQVDIWSYWLFDDRL